MRTRWSVFFLMARAICRNASSMLMLALALVSIKGTWYSAASYGVESKNGFEKMGNRKVA